MSNLHYDASLWHSNDTHRDGSVCVYTLCVSPAVTLMPSSMNSSDSSMYSKSSTQRLISISNISLWPPWPAAKETPFISREQTLRGGKEWPLGNEIREMQLFIFLPPHTVESLLFCYFFLSSFPLRSVSSTSLGFFMGAPMNPEPGKAAQPWSCSAEERNCKAALIMSPWIF